MNSTDGTTSVDMSAIIDLQLLVQVVKNFLWLAKKATVKAFTNTGQFLTACYKCNCIFQRLHFQHNYYSQGMQCITFSTQNYIAKKESK